MTQTAFNESLFTHRQQLIQFLTAFPIGVAIVEKDGCTYLNSAGRQLLGKETGEWEDLRSRSEITASKVDRFEVCREGCLIPVEVRTIPVLDDGGEILYTLLTFQEILSPVDDDREQAIALQESEAKFQRLAENIPGVIYRYVLHPDGSDQVTYISPNARDLHEREPEAILQDVRLVLDLVHPDDAQSLQASILTSAQTLQPWRWEGRITTPSGCLKWVQGFSRPERKANGDIVWDGLLIDITERHTAEAALRDSEARFRSLAENLPGVIFQYVIHADGMSEFLYLSPGARHFYEREPEEVKAIARDPQRFCQLIHAEDLPDLQAGLFLSAQTLEPYSVEYRIVTPSGRSKWVQGAARPKRQVNGDVVWDGLLIDITARKQAEAERLQAETALRESETRFRRLAANVPGMIYRYILHTDGTDEFTYLSPHCREIYEIDAELMMQNTQLLWAAVYPDDVQRVQGAIADALQNPKSINLEHRITTPSGQIKWIQVIAQPEMQPNGDSVWDGVAIDITLRKFGEQLLADYNHTLEQQVQCRTLELQQEILERKRAEAVAKAAESALRQANLELERLASLDSLTQVANRRLFNHYLSQQWQQMQREQNPLSLIIGDVDYFKHYNDHYGHQEGDRCLQRIAEMMSQVVKRAIDLVARYGGEEFAIILPNTDLKGAIYIAEDIRETMQRLQISHAQSKVCPFVTVSLGVASLIPTLDSSPERLISEADQALYRAKRAGRNCTIGMRDEG
jgi:diguanylate cyclase (GGDEF)-like protein/PAS domain S-box-containing protein